VTEPTNNCGSGPRRGVLETSAIWSRQKGMVEFCGKESRRLAQAEQRWLDWMDSDNEEYALPEDDEESSQLTDTGDRGHLPAGRMLNTLWAQTTSNPNVPGGQNLDTLKMYP